MSSLDSLNIDSFCSRVDLSAERPLIDLSDVGFVEPFAMVYLGMFLRHHNHLGKSFLWQHPKGPDVRKYLADMRFYERFNFDPATVSGEALLRHPRPTSLNDVVDIEKTDDVAEYAARMTADVIRQSKCTVCAGTGLVAEVVSELADNFAQHSGTALAAFTTQLFPRRRKLTVAFGDCGLGIRKTLLRNPEYSYLRHQADWKAILLAFTPLVSCRGEGGTGLTLVQDAVMSSGGRLAIASGSGWIMMDGVSKKNWYRVTDFNLPGVQLEVSFPTA